jgi:hypothetical protein
LLKNVIPDGDGRVRGNLVMGGHGFRDKLSLGIHYSNLIAVIGSLVICLWYATNSRYLAKVSSSRKLIMVGISMILLYKVLIYSLPVIMSLFSFEAFVKFDLFAQFLPVLNIVGIVILTIGVVRFFEQPGTDRE